MLFTGGSGGSHRLHIVVAMHNSGGTERLHTKQRWNTGPARTQAQNSSPARVRVCTR